VDNQIIRLVGEFIPFASSCVFHPQRASTNAKTESSTDEAR